LPGVIGVVRVGWQRAGDLKELLVGEHAVLVPIAGRQAQASGCSAVRWSVGGKHTSGRETHNPDSLAFSGRGGASAVSTRGGHQHAFEHAPVCAP
jgi:hypothetical protein